MNISYDYYRIFYCVAKYGNLSQAAKVLMNNQPNLTRTIKNLESALGCPLFSRTNRGMKLTPEGKKLYTLKAAIWKPAPFPSPPAKWHCAACSCRF